MGLKAFVLVVLVFGLGYYGYHNNDQVKQFVDNFSQQAESVATQVKTQVKSTIQATSDDGVLVLTDSNFQEQIKANEYVLVEFYATWCGHCKKLAPEYAKAAEVLKSNKSPVVLAKVEATESPNIAKEHDIKGYPTLKFFHNGQATEYDGGRTTSEIVNWLNKKTGLVSTHLQSVEAIAQFKKDNKVCIIVYTESDITDVFSAVKAAALEMDKVSFAHVTDAALVKGEQAKNGDVVLFRKFEEPRNLFEGKVTKENVLAWVNKMRIPAIMEFDDDAIELVFQSKLVSLIIFHNKSEKSLTARKLFDQVANEGKGNSLNYVTCTPTDASGHYARLAEFLGADVSNQDVPRLVLLDTSEGKIVKFLFSEEFSVENLKKFQQDFFDKNLKQALKSQEIPPESEQGDVRVIVGKAFQAEVLDTKKDVLVKFYAPWCGHCKSLAPHWEEAAAKLKKVNPNIVLAKVDSTLNEVEGIDIQGYPTLKFFPGNNKSNVQEFDGDRSTEGILKWLKEHTTHEWVELNKEEAKTDL